MMIRQMLKISKLTKLLIVELVDTSTLIQSRIGLIEISLLQQLLQDIKRTWLD